MQMRIFEVFENGIFGLKLGYSFLYCGLINDISKKIIKKLQLFIFLPLLLTFQTNFIFIFLINLSKNV